MRFLQNRDISDTLNIPIRDKDGSANIPIRDDVLDILAKL